MDSRGSAHSHARAFPTSSDRRNAPSRLLGTRSIAVLFADAHVRDRTLVSQAPAQPQHPQQTLEAYLQPLIGDDATPVSAQLLERFGTISRVIDASPEALASALIGNASAAAAICAARCLVQHAVNEQLVGAQVDAKDKAFHTYLRTKLENPVEERMHVIFLDANGMFLAGETVASGSSSGVIMHVRHVIHRALDLGATSLILAHNHPSGSCQPSEEDYSATKTFIEIAGGIGIEIVDHMVVSRTGIFSMKKGQRL